MNRHHFYFYSVRHDNNRLMLISPTDIEHYKLNTEIYEPLFYCDLNPKNSYIVEIPEHIDEIYYKFVNASKYNIIFHKVNITFHKKSQTEINDKMNEIIDDNEWKIWIDNYYEQLNVKSPEWNYQSDKIYCLLLSDGCKFIMSSNSTNSTNYTNSTNSTNSFNTHGIVVEY